MAASTHLTFRIRLEAQELENLWGLTKKLGSRWYVNNCWQVSFSCLGPCLMQSLKTLIFCYIWIRNLRPKAHLHACISRRQDWAGCSLMPLMLLDIRQVAACKKRITSVLSIFPSPFAPSAIKLNSTLSPIRWALGGLKSFPGAGSKPNP